MAVTNLPEVSDYIGYGIPTCILYFKNREQPVEMGEISSFSIGRNYRGNQYFPDFEISFIVDRLTFFDIMREKDSLKMLLKVTFFGVAPVKGEESIRTIERVWFNEKFITYLDSNQYDMMEKQVKEIDALDRYQEDKQKDIAHAKKYTVTLNLYKESDINAAYSINNNVYSNADKNTIVAHLLYKSGVKNVLMSPLVNETLKEAITLPVTLISNLQYLIAQYGLHSHGTWFFFDLDVMYILNNKPGCTVWKKGDMYKKVIFTVREDTDDKMFMGGSRMHEDYNGYVNIDPKNIKIESFSSADSLITGGEIRSINHKTNSVKSIKAATQARKLYPKYLHNKYSNKLADEAIRESIIQRDKVITIRSFHSNIGWINPYKDFAFTFVNQKLEKELGGQYVLLNMFTSFNNNGTYFEPQTTLQLSKTK